MIRVRRPTTEPRLELTPLIDVVFLLVTFFIFALALTVRLKVSDITLPALGEGSPASPEARLVLGLTQSGELVLDGQSIAWEALGLALDERLAAPEPPTLYIAPDEGVPTGTLMELLDTLANRGIRDIKFLRRPADATPVPTGP